MTIFPSTCIFLSELSITSFVIYKLLSTKRGYKNQYDIYGNTHLLIYSITIY